jgi:hypothetical protein
MFHVQQKKRVGEEGERKKVLFLQSPAVISLKEFLFVFLDFL